MNIVVCIKQVALAYHPSTLDIARGALITERLVRFLNPHDEIAIEQALRLKAAVPQASITLLSAGGPEMDSALRRGYAMGGRDVSRLVRIETDANDAAVVARDLARFIGSLSPDLVLCGKLAVDTQGGVMSGFLGEYLELPQISCALELTLNAGGGRNEVLIVKNVGKGNREEWRACLPVLVSMDSGRLQPRYPRLADRLAADSVAIECLRGESLGSDRTSLPAETYSLPRPKARRVVGVDSSLSAEERMSAMTSGPEKKAVTVFDEPAPAAAQRILALLRAQEFI